MRLRIQSRSAVPESSHKRTPTGWYSLFAFRHIVAFIPSAKKRFRVLDSPNNGRQPSETARRGGRHDNRRRSLNLAARLGGPNRERAGNELGQNRRRQQAGFTGTRAGRPDHTFERLIHTADYSQIHSGDGDHPLLLKEIRKANPSWGSPGFSDLHAQILHERDTAKRTRDSMSVARFAALRVNAGILDVAENPRLVDHENWAVIEVRGPGICRRGMAGSISVSIRVQRHL